MTKTPSGGVCHSCGKKLAGSLKYPYKNKFYCFDCFKKIEEIIQNENNKENDFIEYIKEFFQVNQVSESIVSFIRKAVESKERTFEGMKYTIYYYYKVMGNEPNIEFLTWVLKDKYSEARKFYEDQQRIKKVNEGIDINSTPSITVKIKKSDLENKKPKFNYKIEDL